MHHKINADTKGDRDSFNTLENLKAAVESILVAIGEDPSRTGLQDTPKRVAEMYLEIFSGLKEDPLEHLETLFTADEHEGTVIVKDITFFSMCEHHLLPFFGKVHIAYLPKESRLAGLSKLASITETIARRPQLQERLSTQIADTLVKGLAPFGVLVVVEAIHMCMAMRGARSPDSKTVTSVSRGVFQTDQQLRAETYQLFDS